MARRTITLTEAVYDYVLDVSLREPEVMRRLREETATHPRAEMQVAPEQAQFLTFLVKLMGASRTLEVGVFTGYSSLAVALALPDSGRIVGCDVSEEFTSVARRYWREAGVERKIDLRLGPAQDTLDALLAAGERESFDFAFIDADKTGYIDYYERAMQLVRPGGVIAADNVLRRGAVADPSDHDRDTEAIRRFNAHVRDDRRILPTLVPIGDGMTLALRRT
jgi:predicted O-methyltransferase YrrM